MKIEKMGLLFLSMILVTTAITAAASKSIFDDDWTPPKGSETPRPAPIKPPAPVPPPPTDPAKKVDPPAAIEKEPSPAVRHAVPAKAEQAAVRKVLKEVFAQQLTDRTIAGRRKLTEALLGQAKKSTDAPVDEFVLLAASIDAGTEGASLPLAFQAADQMAAAFEVDPLSIKADTTIKLSSKPQVAEFAAENVKTGLALTDDLAAADDFAVAARVCSALVPIAQNPALRAEVVQRQRELTAVREASEKVARHVEKLKTAPEDPTANLEVGKYSCFFKNDWKTGLPALSRGSDAALRSLAAKELASPESAEARTALGDNWWDLAQATNGPARRAMQGHAVDLYTQALPELKGLNRIKVDKRIAEAGKSAAPLAAKGHIVDLLKLIDPEKDTVQGKFAIEKGELINLGKGQQRIEIPYHPPEEYDFRVEFTRQQGNDCVIQVLSKDKIPFIWVMADNYTFHYLKNGGLYGNDTTINDKPPLKTGTRYTSIVQVRKTGVKTFLNGKLIADWKTDYQSINPDVPFWALRDKSILGLGIGGTGTVFHSADLYEITGTGSKSR